MNFYEWLLRAYPESFRERYADAMRRTFAHEYAEYSAASPLRRANFWFFTTFHALCFGTLERFPKGPLMRSFFAFDLRDAVRSLRSTPVITTVALLSLALGIGANTALFSILNGLVLKPLPVKAPQQLALLSDGSWTNPIWEGIRDRAADRFDGAFAWSSTAFDLAPTGQTDPVEGVYASGDFFGVLGVTATVGRTFTRTDDTREAGKAAPVAVISDRLWKTRFGGTPDVVGKSIRLNRVNFTIVGVTPASFWGIDVGGAKDVFVPLAAEGAIRGADSALDRRSNWWLEIMVRRRADQSIDAATTALNSARPAVRDLAVPTDWTAKMQADFLKDPWQLIDATTGTSPLRDKYAQPLTIILVVVGAVLLIACANIANLLLARATARRHEMSLRMALGASRLGLARQMLAESALLALGGGVAGLALAKVGGSLLVQQLAAGGGKVSLDLSADWRVFAFTGGAAMLTTLLFGLAPAFGVAGVEPNDALKEHTRSVTGDRRFGVRNALVVCQVALSLVLLIGAGLFVRTFSQLAAQPLGFDPEPLLIVNVNATRVDPANDARRVVAEGARDAILSVPGVRAAAASFLTPLSGSGWNGRALVDGGPELPVKERMIWVNPVQPGWFDTYGMSRRMGRDFSPADTAGNVPVVIVNETFVKRFVGAQNPIGARVKADIVDDVSSYTIVGVVNDAIYRNSRAGVYATVYVPYAQAGPPGSGFALTANIAGDRAATRRAIIDTLAKFDSRLAFSLRDYTAQVRGTMGQERLVAVISGFFGVLAVVLAALGLYGVTSYSVNRRRSEIAVRMALGATSPGVVRMILRRVGVLVAVGVAIGLGLTVWASKFVGALLYGLTARDPMTFAAAAGLLLAVGIAAGWLPARRASRLDPTAVLRD